MIESSVILLSLLAGQGASEPLERIVRSAEQAVRALLPADASGNHPRYEIQVRAPDSRLQLAACERPPQARLAYGDAVAARMSVQVRCAGPVSWSVQLPVELSSEIDVLVVQRPLPRGARPQPGDVLLARRRVPGVSADYVNLPAQLDGYHLKRPVAAGGVLALADLDPDPVIRRGMAVTLVTSTGSFEVRAPGRALADAALGERVRIQNLASAKVVEGLAERSGTVRVD